MVGTGGYGKKFQANKHGYCSISTQHCWVIEAANVPRSGAGNASIMVRKKGTAKEETFGHSKYTSGGDHGLEASSQIRGPSVLFVGVSQPSF